MKYECHELIPPEFIFAPIVLKSDYDKLLARFTELDRVMQGYRDQIARMTARIDQMLSNDRQPPPSRPIHATLKVTSLDSTEQTMSFKSFDQPSREGMEDE